jgi:hypothetical protein
MSEDTWGTPVHLQCGHWIYIKDEVNYLAARMNLIDGCPRCAKLEMRDNKDRQSRQH